MITNNLNLKPRIPKVDIKGQLSNSKKISPSESENKSEYLDLSEHSVKPKKESSSTSRASSGKHDTVNIIESDDLDMPIVSINDLGRSGKSIGQRTVKVSNFTPRDVRDALSGISEHGTLATAGSRKHLSKPKNVGGSGGGGGGTQSGKEPPSSSSTDAWAEAHRKSKQPRRASEAHKITSLGEPSQPIYNPNE